MYLLWKEYRDMRSIFASIFLLFLGCLWLTKFESSWLKLASVVFFVFIIFYAMILGANAFALERRLGTLDFLMSKPISHMKIWLVKFSLRSSLLAIPLCLFWSVTEFYMTILFATSFQGLFILSLFMIFSLCFFFSTILSQPVTASAAGFTIYLGSLLIFLPMDIFWPFVVFCTTLTLISLILSLVLFQRSIVVQT